MRLSTKIAGIVIRKAKRTTGDMPLERLAESSGGSVDSSGMSIGSKVRDSGIGLGRLIEEDLGQEAR